MSARRTLPPLLFLLAVAGAAAAQERPDSGAFFLRIGRDTVLAERYVRRGGNIVAETVLRVPQTRRQRVEARLSPTGALESIEAFSLDPDAGAGAPAVPGSAVTARGDSVYYSGGVGVNSRPQAVPGRMDFVATPFSVAWFENLTLRAPRTVGDSLVLTQMSTFGPLRLLVRRTAADSVAMSSPLLGTMRARIDPSGRLLALDGTESTLGYSGERTAWMDLDSVQRVFAERERTAGAAGSLSPRGRASATINGVKVAVDYGRPAKRGRVVFGGVVPWGRVWRTGANRATHLTTDGDLRIGDALVPAGTYTLWTIPSPEGWTLVINRGTGQWGTFYDPTQDLARVPMRVRSLDAPVERLTITVERGEEGEGVLRLMWDATEASIRVRRK